MAGVQQTDGESVTIEVENLTKRYGSFLAVDDISFTARDGDLTCLLGPSGCGKTTTLRCIAGLERPQGGRITIGDQVVADPGNDVFVPPHERDIGMVFQTFDVWPHMTVFENVAYPLENRGISKAEIRERVQRTLELTGIEDEIDKTASQLSGGQQARVGICRAIVYEPQVLLFDEPLTGLDRNLRKQMRYEIKRIQTELDITSVYVTHSQPEAMTLSDRIALMNPDGRIEQMGTVENLYDRPESWFACDFFGSLPPLTGQVTGTGAEVDGLGVLECDSKSLSTGTTVLVGVRPNCVDVSTKPKDTWSEANTREGTVKDVSFLGDSHELTITVDGSEIRATQRRLGEMVKRDDDIFLHLNPAGIHVFAEAGE